ncbi:testicular spindle-associated protein SHCBP1L-like isoform X3 [Ciona intestinalis]
MAAKVEPKTLEEAIEEINLDEVPSTSTHPPHTSSCTVIPTVSLVTLPKFTCQERYDIYCKEVKIAACRPSQVLHRVHLYLEENLANKHWMAMWRGPYGGDFPRTVDILVKVEDVCGDQAQVSLVDPLVCNEATVPREVVDAQLRELEYTLDITELFPVDIDHDEDDSSEEEGGEGVRGVGSNERMGMVKEQERIAQIVHHARFYFENLRRDWDDEDEGEHSFDAYLRARLQLYYDVITGLVPAPLVQRYDRTMAKYLVRRRELLDYQARIQSEGEPTNSEAVECWRKYYEVLMLSGLLQIWETLQLRTEGPCFPRVLRRTKGPRADGYTVTHIVVDKLTPAMLRSFHDDAVMQQHKTPQSALQQSHEGDIILIFPGTYSGEGFHELTESITIKGEGERDDIIIEAIPYDDLFVNVSSADVTIENITFNQADNTEGILRVESGHARLVNCLLRCDGTGVTVREGASITMRGCTITGAKGPGIELMAGCTADLDGNHIHHYPLDVDVEQPGKGGIHLHVIDPPKAKLSNNQICGEGGVGITMGRHRASRLAAHETKQAEGDAPTMRTINDKADLVKNMVNIEMSNNTFEDLAV